MHYLSRTSLPHGPRVPAAEPDQRSHGHLSSDEQITPLLLKHPKPKPELRKSGHFSLAAPPRSLPPLRPRLLPPVGVADHGGRLRQVRRGGKPPLPHLGPASRHRLTFPPSAAAAASHGSGRRPSSQVLQAFGVDRTKGLFDSQVLLRAVRAVFFGLGCGEWATDLVSGLCGQVEQHALLYGKNGEELRAVQCVFVRLLPPSCLR